jgi:hypothetical protein
MKLIHSKKCLVLLFLFLASGCASTYKGKILESMALGLLVGGAYGMGQEHQPEANAALWGGLGSAGAGVVSLYLQNDDKELDRLAQENQKLREAISQGLGATRASTSIRHNRSLSGAPKGLENVFSSGRVQHAPIDEWEQDPNDESIWYHKTEQVELIPPHIKTR